MTAASGGAEPDACTEARPAPLTIGVIWNCDCGHWWVSNFANDVFTELPTLIWRRVGWWDFEARLAIHRHSKATR